MPIISNKNNKLKIEFRNKRKLIMLMRVDTWVFLDTSLEESLKRIKIRNRSAECG